MILKARHTTNLTYILRPKDTETLVLSLNLSGKIRHILIGSNGSNFFLRRPHKESLEPYRQEKQYSTLEELIFDVNVKIRKGGQKHQQTHTSESSTASTQSYGDDNESMQIEEKRRAHEGKTFIAGLSPEGSCTTTSKRFEWLLDLYMALYPRGLV